MRREKPYIFEQKAYEEIQMESSTSRNNHKEKGVLYVQKKEIIEETDKLEATHKVALALSLSRRCLKQARS